MAINLDTIAAALPTRNYNFMKASQTSKAAGSFHSLWKAAGLPIAGSNPPAYTAGSGYIPTRATTGALGQVNPSGNLYLSQLVAVTSVVGHLIIYDRLWACSGMSANTTSTQTITTPGTLTSGRDPNNGADVEPWLEWYTTDGATGTGTYTLTGTDSSGTTGRTWTFTRTATTEIAGQMIPLVPGTAVGGCRVPTSVALSVATGTAGDFGVTLLRRIAQIPLSIVGVGAVLDAFATGLPEVYDDSCIAMLVNCSTTTTGQIMGSLALPELTP